MKPPTCWVSLIITWCSTEGALIVYQIYLIVGYIGYNMKTFEVCSDLAVLHLSRSVKWWQLQQIGRYNFKY
jgi:hypothetical protein